MGFVQVVNNSQLNYIVTMGEIDNTMDLLLIQSVTNGLAKIALLLTRRKI